MSLQIFARKFPGAPGWTRLTPIVILLLTLGLILVATEGSALAPFIYSLF